MNKFQPKIADFGCEIVDAISNGLRPYLVEFFGGSVGGIWGVGRGSEEELVWSGKKNSTTPTDPCCTPQKKFHFFWLSLLFMPKK